jgi:hypothetical protein
MGRICSTHGEDEKCIQNFSRNPLNLRNLVKNGRIILKWLLKTYGWDVDWVQLPQTRAQCCDVVNWIMNFRVP